MLGYAKQKSDALGANATWIRSDVLETPSELDGTAELVYSGKGATCWMMDLDAWAAVVWRLLKPGGKFFFFEGHPLDSAWNEDSEKYELREGGTYFEASSIRGRGFPFEAAGRTEPEKPVELTSRVWTVGQTVTAVANVGMRVEHLEEFPEPFWDQFKHIPVGDMARLPHTFGLVATKE